MRLLIPLRRDGKGQALWAASRTQTLGTVFSLSPPGHLSMQDRPMYLSWSQLGLRPSTWWGSLQSQWPGCPHSSCWRRSSAGFRAGICGQPGNPISDDGKRPGERNPWTQGHTARILALPPVSGMEWTGSACKSLTRIWNFTDGGGMRSQGRGGLEVENLSAGIVWEQAWLERLRWVPNSFSVLSLPFASQYPPHPCLQRGKMCQWGLRDGRMIARGSWQASSDRRMEVSHSQQVLRV